MRWQLTCSESMTRLALLHTQQAVLQTESNRIKILTRMQMDFLFVILCYLIPVLALAALCDFMMGGWRE